MKVQKCEKKLLLHKIGGNKDDTINWVTSWGGAFHIICQHFVYLDIAQFDFSLIECMRKSKIWL